MKKKIIIASISIIVIGIIATIIIINATKVSWDYETNGKTELRDYQNYWLTTSGVMKGEDCYYYVYLKGDLNIMYEMNEDCTDVHIICDKANCKHEDESCKAVWNGKVSNFQYSNGYFFYKVQEDNNDYYLYRAHTDGTNRQKLLKLSDANETRSIQTLFVHRDYVVAELIMNDGKNVKIVVFDMNKDGISGNSTTVATVDFVGDMSVKDVYGDNILYQECKGDSYVVHEYNIVNGTDREVCKFDNKCGYVCSFKDSIIASNSDGIFAVDAGGSVKKISEMETKFGPYIRVYGDYLYAYYDEDNYIEIYNKNYDKVAKLDNAKDSAHPMMPCYFGDESKLFTTVFSSKDIYYCDKAGALAGNADWKKITID